MKKSELIYHQDSPNIVWDRAYAVPLPNITTPEDIEDNFDLMNWHRNTFHNFPKFISRFDCGEFPYDLKLQNDTPDLEYPDDITQA